MTVGVAVIGLGFMGRTHVRAYRNAGSACRLVGVYDIDPSRLTGESGEAGNIATGSDEARLFDPDEVFATDSLDKLLASDEVDAVSVCTPTDTHCAVARAALRAGTSPASTSGRIDHGDVVQRAGGADERRKDPGCRSRLFDLPPIGNRSRATTNW